MERGFHGQYLLHGKAADVEEGTLPDFGAFPEALDDLS